jgi:hypothetical protein
MGNTLEIPSPTKLARLGHFLPARQAGRLAGLVFYVYVFSLVTTAYFVFCLYCVHMRGQAGLICITLTFCAIYCRSPSPSSPPPFPLSDPCKIMHNSRAKIFARIKYNLLSRYWGWGGGECKLEAALMSKYQDCKTKPALANIYPICIYVHAHSGSVYKQEFCHGIAHQAFGISYTVYSPYF